MKFLKWTAIIIVGLAVIGAGCSSDEKKESGQTADNNGQETATAEPTPEATPEPTPEPVSVNVRGRFETTSDEVTLRGRVNLSGSTVKVNGRKVPVKGKGWRATVAITKKGDNDYRVVASKSGHGTDRTTHTVTRKLTAAERAAIEAAKRQAFVNEAIDLPYNQLEKNPRAHKGDKVVMRGQIFQIQEDSGETWMLLAVTHDAFIDFWDDNVWVDYSGTINSAEDDVITVYGTVTGAKSYETQIGGETYVPRVRAKYIEE